MAANVHFNHDAVTGFRCTNRLVVEAAFPQTLLLPRETGLPWLAIVSIDGSKIGTNACKIQSVRYGRAHALRVSRSFTPRC